MPRDSTRTRARLLAEAERLFADVGIWRVTVREIVEAAGQRNASALTYHFGSREGALDRILAAHGAPIDDRRGELLSGLDTTAPTHAYLSALVQPMTACLADQRGRRYLRIVAQLAERFPTWRDESTGLVPPNLDRALRILEERPLGLPETVRRERLLAMMQLMTSSLAERARVLDDGLSTELDGDSYESNLTDMLVGLLGAPAATAV